MTTKDGTVQLTATVTPDNATNKEVIWTSSNTGVATVDANGKVTAVANGTCTITVTTADGSKTATCTVKVDIPAIYFLLMLLSLAAVTGVAVRRKRNR
ncbi:MAG: Ig domain-containing protein [Roseburia sp.]